MLALLSNQCIDPSSKPSELAPGFFVGLSRPFPSRLRATPSSHFLDGCRPGMARVSTSSPGCNLRPRKGRHFVVRMHADLFLALSAIKHVLHMARKLVLFNTSLLELGEICTQSVIQVLAKISLLSNLSLEL